MKIEFENSVTRLSFLCGLPDIEIASINSRMCIVFNAKCGSFNFEKGILQ